MILARMVDAFLAELEQEAGTTRRVLERVPEGKLGWKPHAKSMSLGQLALHVASIPGGVASFLAGVIVGRFARTLQLLDEPWFLETAWEDTVRRFYQVPFE